MMSIKVMCFAALLAFTNNALANSFTATAVSSYLVIQNQTANFQNILRLMRDSQDGNITNARFMGIVDILIDGNRTQLRALHPPKDGAQPYFPAKFTRIWTWHFAR